MSRILLVQPGDILVFGNVGAIDSDSVKAMGATLKADLGVKHVLFFEENVDMALVRGEAGEPVTTDDVYRERARLVAHLASLYPSVITYDPAEPDWPLVYIASPTGQLSWHLSEDDLDLFAHVEIVPSTDPRAQWDQHTTHEKYLRLGQMIKPIGYRDRDVRDTADLPERSDS